LKALEASAYLHHLHLASPQPLALGAFYAKVLDMQVEGTDGGAIFAHGSGRRVRITNGPAKHLFAAGFAIRDADGLAGLKARAMAEGLEPMPYETPLFQSGAFKVVDPDSNVVGFGLAVREEKEECRRLSGPLQHLTLASRDVGALEEFYAGKLGFRISDRVVRDDGKVMTSFMRGNHEHHTLAVFYQDRVGIDHHSYEAGQWGFIRDWCDHFASCGVKLMWGPGRHGPGNNLFVFIVDPDGNRIEVSAELEVVHDREMKIWPHEERTLNLWGSAILRA
jgi:catechol 2,3-dioxygenase-like lactoylglutathione lyase family enzyme